MLSYFEKNTITITNDMFNIILITLIDTYHNLDQFDKTLDSIINYTELNALNECSFNLTIRLCVKLNNTEKIYHLLNIMKTEDIQIKKRTITPLIHLFFETKNIDLMETIYPLLFDGITLKDNDYIMLLSFFGENQYVDKFETTFKLMIEQLDIISNELSSIYPSIKHLEYLIQVSIIMYVKNVIHRFCEINYLHTIKNVFLILFVIISLKKINIF